MMGYIIWMMEDEEPRIVDTKNQLPSAPIMGQSHNYLHSYAQFQELIGKKTAEKALEDFHAQLHWRELKSRRQLLIRNRHKSSL